MAIRHYFHPKRLQLIETFLLCHVTPELVRGGSFLVERMVTFGNFAILFSLFYIINIIIIKSYSVFCYLYMLYWVKMC